MNPSIEIRIDSMIRALSQCIIPELPADSAAAEQASLVAGHLGVLKEQIDLSAAFDQYELGCVEALSTALLAEFAGGPESTAAADRIRRVLEDGANPRLPAAVRARTDELGALIERFIRAVGHDGDSEFRRRATDLVMSHERERMAANRSMFRGMDWESDITELPELDTMLFDR